MVKTVYLIPKAGFTAVPVRQVIATNSYSTTQRQVVPRTVKVRVPTTMAKPLDDVTNPESFLCINKGKQQQKPRRRERLTHLTAEEKLNRRKMKNREAAQNARDRKKEQSKKMEDVVKHLAAEAKRLKEENAALRAQLSTCQCHLVNTAVMALPQEPEVGFINNNVNKPNDETSYANVYNEVREAGERYARSLDPAHLCVNSISTDLPTNASSYSSYTYTTSPTTSSACSQLNLQSPAGSADQACFSSPASPDSAYASSQGQLSPSSQHHSTSLMDPTNPQTRSSSLASFAEVRVPSVESAVLRNAQSLPWTWTRISAQPAANNDPINRRNLPSRAPRSLTTSMSTRAPSALATTLLTLLSVLKPSTGRSSHRTGFDYCTTIPSVHYNSSTPTIPMEQDATEEADVLFPGLPPFDDLVSSPFVDRLCSELDLWPTDLNDEAMQLTDQLDLYNQF